MTHVTVGNSTTANERLQARTGSRGHPNYYVDDDLVETIVVFQTPTGIRGHPNLNILMSFALELLSFKPERESRK